MINYIFTRKILLFLLVINKQVSSELFNGLTLYYNQEVRVNSKQHILIVVDNTGNKDVNFELYTSTYVIASFLFPEGVKFQLTKHLSQTCKDYGITNPTKKPPKSVAHYVLAAVTFVQPGSDEMTLTAIDPDTQNEYFREKYKIEVLKLPGYQCFPKIRFTDCSSPHTLRKVALHQKITIKAIVERSCGMDSRMLYEWKVNDFLDKETRITLAERKSPVLRISAFKLWFNDADTTFHKFYTVKVRIKEIRSNGTGSGEAYGRCYIAVLTAPPIAKIKFGASREVNVNKPFKLDGSESRDMTSPKNGINLSYHWSCSTSSTKNTYCKSDMGYSQTLRIPANSLSLSEKYTFSLQIKSTRTLEYAKAFQVIMPTLKEPLLVSYICVRNCLEGIANVRDKIHIKADCLNCNAGPITYKWTLEQPTAINLEQGPRLFLEPTKIPPNSVLLTLRLDAHEGGRSGFTELEIKLVRFSKIGSCYIRPKEGIEYSTEFRITCYNFMSEFEPLTYSFYQERQLLASQQNDEIKLRLSKTGNSQASKLRVNVADILGNTHNVEINVPLKPLGIPINSKDILNFIDADLNELINSDDMVSVATKVRTAANLIKKISSESEKVNITEHILDMLSKLKLLITDDVEITSSMLNTLLMNLTLNHTLAIKSSHIFNIVSNSLEKSIRSEETDLTPERYSNMTRSFVETAEQFFKPAEEFPLVHTADIPRPDNFEDENYPDYGELDFDIVYRINNWEHFAESTSRLFHNLGLVAFQINEAEEQMTILTDGAKWIMKMIGPDNQSNVTQVDEGSMIVIPSSLLKTLMLHNDPKAKVGVQMVFPVNNPYWWYPAEHKTSTHIATINVFSYKYNSSNFTVQEVDTTFDIFFQITNKSESTQSIETYGYVLPKEDMPIYQCTLPRHAYISIQFIDVSAPIRVLAKIGEIPKYKEILKSYEVVTSSTEAFDIVGFNNGSEDSNSYIAIYPHSNTSDVTTYHFKSTIYACNTWDPKDEKWATTYCFVGNATNETHIHCQCWHFSNFVARLFKTPNSIELPRNVVLSLYANIVFLLIYTLIVLLLLGVIFWAKNRDKEDRVISQILHVDPYNPEKTYVYLATISTGIFTYAGTTARISIELIGSRMTSEKYFLSVRRFYGAFKRNSESTFALATEKYLGPLNSIILTNDYTGRYPSWYCNYVRVKDPTRKEEFVFIVNRWLSKVYSDTLSVNVSLATERQLNNLKYVVVEHFKRCFRDLCTWYGLLYPSHRSPLSRMEKAMVLVTGFSFGAMLSIMFFERTTLDNIEEERVRYRRFILTLSTVLHTVLCTIAAVFLALVIIEMFVRSKRAPPLFYKIIYAKDEPKDMQDISTK